MIKKLYPIFKDGVFSNRQFDSVVISTKKIILHYIFGIFNFSHVYHSKKHYAAIPQSIKKKDYNFLSDEKIMIIPLGHASVLIKYGKFSILIDPVFYAVSFFFRRFTPDISLAEMPHIDLVVYSHNHPDHFCKRTLKEIIKHSPHVKIIAPLKFNEVIKNSFWLFSVKQEIITLNWWEEYRINEKISITGLPAIHWSQSNFIDRNKSLWSSWMITIKNKYIYFAGDSAYGEHFKLIRKVFPSVDVACLPIAPYEPKDIQIDSHMNVKESYQAFKELGSSLFLPIHWGVFAYGEEQLKDPIRKIILLMKKYNCLSRLICTVYNESFFI